jgi:DNA-binding response OmpR family regulator
MGRSYSAALKPNLVLLELGLPDVSVVELARVIRAGSPQAVLIGMTDDALPACRATAIDYGVDYCVPLTPMGHIELVAVVTSMQPEQTHH